MKAPHGASLASEAAPFYWLMSKPNASPPKATLELDLIDGIVKLFVPMCLLIGKG